MTRKSAFTILAAGILGAGSLSTVCMAEETDEAKIAAGEYYFGVLDIPYADFYYGEINQIKPEAVKADFATTSVWGNYQISLEGLEVDAAAIQGALLETSDGSIYGLEHLDNLWLQPGEVAFAVTEMTEPHGNTPSYQRFEDIQGKTITKLTYMIADGDDIAVDLDFYCKELLPGEYFVSVPETVIYDPEGTKLNVTEKVPEGSEYDLDSVLAGGYADGTWEGEGMGLNGPIRVAVVVEEGQIKEVKILEAVKEALTIPPI